jgi:hypothetical protein
MFAAPTGVISSFDGSAVLFELKQLQSSQRTMVQQLLTLARDVKDVRLLISQGRYNSAIGLAPELPQLPPAPSMSWTCPICSRNLKHKESFKGHIRKLVYPSNRPGCHLNPLEKSHEQFARRFNGLNFSEQAYEFCKEFYHQVCISCTKRDPDDASLRHIWAWLDAARSDSGDFPVYDTRCQMISSKRRCAAQQGDFTTRSSSQSTAVSSSSGGSSALYSNSSPNL